MNKFVTQIDNNMFTNMKKESLSLNKPHGNAIVSKHVKNFSNDIVFVKKREAAKAVLEKFGFPDQK